MVGFALGVQASVEEPFQKMELINRIDVSPPRNEATGGKESPALDESALERMRALPGVVLAYPDYRLEKLGIARGEQARTVPATTMPREAGRLPWVEKSMLAGHYFTRGVAPEVILSRRLLRPLGFKSPEDAIGETMTLKAKGLLPGRERDFRFQEKQLDVQVVGIWEPPPGRHGGDAESVLLPLDILRDLPGTEFETAFERLLSGRSRRLGTYGRVVVRVARPADLYSVERELRASGYRPETFLGRLEELRKGFVLMDLVLTAVGMVALTVSGLGIVNTLLMAVLERTREIGTLKALGASNGDVRLLFFGEAGLVGLLGGVGGLVLGRTVSWGIEKVVNELAHRQGIDDALMPFAFPMGLLGGALLFALVVSLASGVYPAMRAARIDPIRALRAE
jgi:putative ABC transport system permease protein